MKNVRQEVDICELDWLCGKEVVGNTLYSIVEILNVINDSGQFFEDKSSRSLGKSCTKPKIPCGKYRFVYCDTIRSRWYSL